MKPAYVRGVGLWAPGFASADDWCAGRSDEAVDKPACALLEGALRRRATGLTRIAVDAFCQAASEAGGDSASIPSVWATAHGEHASAMKLLWMMHRGEGKVSPIHFHNSVHNTASGYASIAAANAASSTTLTGGPELVAASLLEGFCRIETQGGECIVVVADEPFHAPFVRDDMTAPLALAFHLTSEADGARMALSGLRRDAVSAVKLTERFGSLYVSAGLPLLEHLVYTRPGTVALELETGDAGPVWCVDLERVSD